MHRNADRQRSSAAGNAVANVMKTDRSVRPKGLRVAPGNRNHQLFGDRSPLVQMKPVVQLLKKDQEETLIPLIEKITAFQQLLSTLSDPLEFGLKYYQVEKALTLPVQMEAIKPSIEAIRTLKREVAKDEEVPISEDHILEFACYTMVAVLKPLLARAGKLITLLQGNEVEKQEAYTSLTQLTGKASKVIDTEVSSLRGLLREARPEVKGEPNQTRMISMGEIRPTDTNYSGSQVLNMLRLDFGIQKVYGIEMIKLTRLQSTVILNQLLSILLTYPHPIGLEVTAIIPVPDRAGTGQTWQPVRFIIAQDGVVHLMAESGPAPVDTSRWLTVHDAREALKGKYGISEFLEEGAAWTLNELVQLDDALQKADNIGKEAMRGIKMIRKAAGKQDSDESKEGGSYHPLLHTLSLTNDAFTRKVLSFTGMLSKAGQSSHATILHEVGHAIEYAEIYRASVRLQENVAKAQTAIEQLEKEVAELTATIEKLDREKDIAVDKSTEEKWKVVQELATQIDSAKFEADQAKTRTRGFFNTASETYNAMLDQMPETGPSDVIALLDNYQEKLQGYLQIVKGFDYTGTDTAALEGIVKSLAEAETAQNNWRGHPKASTQPYSGHLHGTLAALKKAGDCFPAILQLNRRYAELKSKMTRLELYYKEQESGISQKFDPELDALKKQRISVREKASTFRHEKHKASGELDDLEMARIGIKTPTLLRFVDFVKEKKILPITLYARTEWGKGNFSEFFAEAYHLFINDPLFLKRSAEDLYNYFAAGKYL